MLFAYPTKICHTSDRTSAIAIVAWFVSQLQSSWDNYLGSSEKNAIISAIKQETNENGDIFQTEDSVNALVYTILLHFVGNIGL